jgi:hypothetical protein
MPKSLPQDANRFAAQHQLPVLRPHPDAPASRVMVNMADSPLAWLYNRGHISARQFEAGERLRRDWETAHRPPRVTMAWDAPPQGRAARSAPEPMDPTLAQISAKRRVTDALADAGPGLAEVLRQVVCEGQGLEAAERLLKWPQRSAKLVLSFALDRLIRFYGL